MFNLLSGLALFLFFRRKSKPGQKENHWQVISQSLFLLSVCFFGLTAYSVNAQLGKLLDWPSLLFIFSIAAMVVAYVFRVSSVLTIGLIGSVGWWLLQATYNHEPERIHGMSLFAGILIIISLMYVLGFMHEKLRTLEPLAGVYTLLSCIGLGGFLFFLSSQDGLESLEGVAAANLAPVVSFVSASLLVLIVAFVVALAYATHKKMLTAHEVGVSLIGPLISGLFLLIPPQLLFLKSVAEFSWQSKQVLTTSGLLWAGVFNIFLFCFILGITFSGYVRRREQFVNAGTFLLFIFIVSKYFDWFFDFLDKSIFFIGAGIILFGVGIALEKGRRYMVANIDHEQTT